MRSNEGAIKRDVTEFDMLCAEKKLQFEAQMSALNFEQHEIAQRISLLKLDESQEIGASVRTSLGNGSRKR